MHEGRVSADREALVSLVVVGPQRPGALIEAVLDTGFTGDLTLSRESIRELGLLHFGSDAATLANGEEVFVNVFRAVVGWHGETRTIAVYEVEGGSLIGMSLLWGSELRLEARAGGAVRITELPPELGDAIL